MTDRQIFYSQMQALGHVEVASKKAVSKAIAEELGTLNMEGLHTMSDAVESLLLRSQQGTVLNVLQAAKAYDAINGSAVTPRVEDRLFSADVLKK